MRLASVRLLVIAIVFGAACGTPLTAQTRQQQVANERAKSTASTVKACPLLTIDEVKKYADKWQAMALADGLYDMGSACDYGGFVTVRVFASNKPDADVEWLIKNYKMEKEKRTAIGGFGRGAFIMFPKPQSKYQDEAAVLVGRAGAKMFMVSFIPPNGKTPQSIQPQLEELAKKVMSRLR